MALVGGATSACASGPDSDEGKLSVVASFYPVAEAAARVGGEFVNVTNLTSTGVEPHDLELTTRDVDRIQDADVLFYVGGGFQPVVSAAVKDRDGATVDVAAGIMKTGDDPHFWLDPTLLAKAVERVRSGLAKADPGHTADYAKNAAAYQAELAALDAEFTATLSTCARHEIVTAHAAFFYLADRYGLVQNAITGVSPEAEPDPQRLADLSELITSNGVTTVFYEELVPRDFADTLAKTAGVKTAVLSPVEGLTRDESAAGDDYASVMRRNLAALATALDCRTSDT